MTPSLPEAFDKLMQSCYTDTKPGAALLVTRAGEVIYEGGTGLADLATGAKITGNTNFRLASVSKQFTAMGIHLLQQQGLLMYDNLLQQFFPELEKIAKGVTVQQLITHTSGLPDYEDLVDDARQDQVTDWEVLDIVAAQSNALFTPSTHYRYSNTGYVLLALIIEKVSGIPYSEFLQRYIFKPLNMQSSLLYEAGKDIPNRAIGYAHNAAGELAFSDQSTCSATKGDGCIYTSVRDYLKWHQALEKNEAFSLENILPAMSTTIGNNSDWNYGMGWFFAKRRNGGYEMYHTGNTCGFSNLVIRIPEEQVLVACFSNIADNPHLHTDLLDVLQEHPVLNLESDLVRHLLELTR